MEKVAVVIMAGGRGERFWPWSRSNLPKQFLCLAGGHTLLQATYERARLLCGPEEIFVVTPARYGSLTRQQLPELPAGNLILEPGGRDTAPCLGLAAARLVRRDPGTVMVVLPADHVIAQSDRFAEVMRAAVRAAAAGGFLVTVGITPTRPETGYGYIQCGEVVERLEGGLVLRRVVRFTEKPPLEQALAFLADGGYLWNSGMFVWRVDALRREVGEHAPWLGQGIDCMAEAIGKPDEEDVVRQCYLSFPSLSIDYGLLEKSRNVMVIPGHFGWDDVGSWPALGRVLPADEGGNVTMGGVLAVDASGCVLCGEPAEVACGGGGRVLVAYGVRGLVVVDAGDVVLVTDRERAADLKRLLAVLREKGYGHLLERREGGFRLPPLKAVPAAAEGEAGAVKVVQKPWGRETWWAVTRRYVGKVIEVAAGHSLSLQYHERKLETMLFLEGSGTLQLDGRALPIEPGLCVTIQPGTVHRVEAAARTVFVEVSSPEVEDVVRLADAYGREVAAGTASPT